jgi:DNA repair protein SbcD/Mre11
MITFIHTADIHLDSPLKGLETHEDAPVQEIRKATRRAFDNLINLAVEKAVDYVLIAGDLYDGDWKDYNTGLFFADRMGKLFRARIRVFIVSGNHDAASQITRAMPLPENVTLFSHKAPGSVVLDDIGVVIHGQSYAARAVTDNLAAGYPSFHAGYYNIGILHTALTGREGHEKYAPCSLDDLTSRGYDYWALGHVHKREIVCEHPWIVFAGSIQGRHINETGAKGATLVTVADDRIMDMETCELDVLRWAVCTIDLSLCDTTETIHDAVRTSCEQEREKTQDRALTLRLKLTGTCPMHDALMDRTARWTEEFQAIAASLGDVWLEQVKYETRRKKDPKELFGKDTPIAGLVTSIEHLELDEQTLFALVPELSQLKTKLPAELYGNGGLFLDTSGDNMAALRMAVQEFLIAKLWDHGGTNETCPAVSQSFRAVYRQRTPGFSLRYTRAAHHLRPQRSRQSP